MNILNIDPINPDSNKIKEATKVLKRGGILVYPTDTCYGIGVDISNPIAFEKVYKIKKRPKNKPVSVIVPDIKDIKNIAIINSKQEEYFKKYLPGAATFILLTLNQYIFPFSSIGLRIPNYQVTQAISNDFKSPYVTTSANISNYPPAYDIHSFISQLSESDLKPDLILDAGKLNSGSLSTIIDLTTTPPKILRQGNLKIESI